jgi:hypothetical protein
MNHTLPGRAREGERIDSGVPSEGFVFVRNQSLEVQRGDIGNGNGMPPDMIFARKRPQRRAVARNNDGGVGGIAARLREREEKVQNQECEECDGGAEDPASSPPQPRRGGCAIKKISRSLLSTRRRGGVARRIC